ncbi:hypothetical protein F4805DRAFT_454775 [Annulohypoxylon moriforme]|nr:hypothetical protein F4805DRAFT_454775 [Annulohypoxylon moriforme]
MSTSSQTRISDDQWRIRQDRILELYLDPKGQLSGPDGVIEMMKREGFSATESQYETKFKKWGIRKYVKRGEYEGDEIPPNIAISDHRRERALRRYRLKGQQASKRVGNNNDHVPQEITDLQVLTRDVSVESLSHNEILSTTEPKNEVINTTSYLDNDSINVDQGIPLYGLTAPEENHPSWIVYQSLNNSPFFDQQPSNDHSALSPQPLSPPFASPSPSEVDRFIRRSYLGLFPEDHLPSIKITDEFIKGIFGKPSATSMHNIILNRSPFTPALQLTSFISETLGAIKSSGSNEGHSSVAILPALENRLFVKYFPGEEQSQLNTLDNEDALVARFYANLIEMVINKATHFEHVPVAAIIRLLGTRGTMRPSLPQFLVSNPTPVTKSFAERIFQMALEVDCIDKVTPIINCVSLVDIHEIVCYRYGERYTPLQIAAMNQSFKAIQFLIKKKVDTNKTLLTDSRHCCSALHMLVNYHHDRNSTLDDNFLDIVDAFLDKNAIISIDTIKISIERLTDPRLAIRLIKKTVSQAPQNLISVKDALANIVKNFEEEDATNTIKLIVQQCQRGRGRTLFQYTSHIDDAINQAMLQRYKGVVETLFPYTLSPRTILRRAITEGNQEIADFILQESPELNETAEYGSVSLAAALTFRNQDHLDSLGGCDMLKHLQDKDKLSEVFAAALSRGNREYANKIIDLDPDFKFADDDDFDLATALSDALANSLDDIAWKILAVGLTTERRYRSTKKPMPLLYVAICARRPEFVRAIIESGFDPDELQVSTSDKWPSLKMAIEWGDESIINDILLTHSYNGLFPSADFLKFTIHKGRRDIFWKILECSYLKGDSVLRSAIMVAVEFCQVSGLGTREFRAPRATTSLFSRPLVPPRDKFGDIPLLERLVALGARVDDDHLLKEAIEKHHSMVKPLLEQFRKGYPEGRTGYGYYPMLHIINHYPETSEWLNIFFAENLVTPDLLRGDGGNDTLLYKAIKGSSFPDTSLIERLLNAGRDIDGRSDVNVSMKIWSSDKDYEKSTALLKAIDIKSKDIIKLLIEHKADINEPARFGIRYTPLQKAAEVNDLEIVRLLLDHGAEVNAAPARFDGATALQFAAIHGNIEMAIMLLKEGAKLDIPPPQGYRGRWPLEGAAEHGRLDMIQLLWNAIPDNSGFDHELCRNAMRLAERNGHIGCRDLIKELMDRPPIDVPMDWAC